MQICLGEGHRGWYLSNLKQFEVLPKKTSWREGGINIESGWRTTPPPASRLPPRVGSQKGSGSWRKYIMPIRRATVRGTQQRHLPGIPWRKPHSREHFHLQKHSNLAQRWACLHLAVVKTEHGVPILGTGFSPKQVHSVISPKRVHSVTLGKPFPLSGPSFSHLSHVWLFALWTMILRIAYHLNSLRTDHVSFLCIPEALRTTGQEMSGSLTF